MEPIAGLFGNCIEDLEYFLNYLFHFLILYLWCICLCPFFSFFAGPFAGPSVNTCLLANPPWTEHVDLYMKFNVSPWNISGVIGSKLIPDVRKPKDGPIPFEMESFGLPLPFQEQKGSKIGAQEQKGSKTGAHGESVKGSESESGTEDEAASDPPSYQPSIAPNEDTIASQSKSPVDRKK